MKKYILTVGVILFISLFICHDSWSFCMKCVVPPSGKYWEGRSDSWSTSLQRVEKIPIRTKFRVVNGRLRGSYEYKVRERNHWTSGGRIFNCYLEDLNRFSCRWSDPDWSGDVTIQFSDDNERFDGYFHFDSRAGTYHWDGHKW